MAAISSGDELLIAVNPSPDSKLPYLLLLPVGGGMLFRTSGTWPRTKALYCHPVPLTEWPADPEIVERQALRACTRRGAAVDVVLDRSRENRSQLVFTTARGRDVVFWQSPRTRKQSRPRVSTPTAKAGGIADLEIVVDTRERYAYRFPTQQVHLTKEALPVGDYGVRIGEHLVAAVERKSLEDLAGSITGSLKYALAELALLPRAAVVVEERYSKIFSLTHVRPAVVADAIAEAQVRWPAVPIVFCDSRKVAEEWTYRYLAAAYSWGTAELALGGGVAPAGTVGDGPPETRTPRTRVATPGRRPDPAAPTDAPPVKDVRAWARSAGLDVPDRGRLPVRIWELWRAEHGSDRR